MAEWKPFDLKWGRSIWYCSACEESTEVPTYLGKPMYNFCPMCGANMNLKSENEKADTPQMDLVKENPSLVKDLVNAFCEDGTWLERQGVYTLTLAEAKQRAVDIIEAVSRKDEADTPQTDCDTCRHYKLACELFSEVCKYEPITQTETQNSNNDTPQKELTAKCLNCHNAKACKKNHWDGCIYEPQTDCGWGKPNE